MLHSPLWVSRRRGQWTAEAFPEAGQRYSAVFPWLCQRQLCHPWNYTVGFTANIYELMNFARQEWGSNLQVSAGSIGVENELQPPTVKYLWIYELVQDMIYILMCPSVTYQPVSVVVTLIFITRSTSPPNFSRLLRLGWITIVQKKNVFVILTCSPPAYICLNHIALIFLSAIWIVNGYSLLPRKHQPPFTAIYCHSKTLTIK